MKATDGEEITPARILDAYLNTGDYDYALGGFVSWSRERGALTFEQEGTGQVISWALGLNPGQLAIPEQA